MTLKQMREAALNSLEGGDLEPSEAASILRALDRGDVQTVVLDRQSGQLVLGKSLEALRAELAAAAADCTGRFHLYHQGVHFASGWYSPARLLGLANDFAEGTYEIRFTCSCWPDSRPAEPFGTLTVYGDGIAVVRGPRGQSWT